MGLCLWLKKETLKICTINMLSACCIKINNNITPSRCEQTLFNAPGEALALTDAARLFLASEQETRGLQAPGFDEHLQAALNCYSFAIKVTCMSPCFCSLVQFSTNKALHHYAGVSELLYFGWRWGFSLFIIFYRSILRWISQSWLPVSPLNLEKHLRQEQLAGHLCKNFLSLEDMCRSIICLWCVFRRWINRERLSSTFRELQSFSHRCLSRLCCLLKRWLPVKYWAVSTARLWGSEHG